MEPRRNEPCPCGSGKRYKHCCGASEPGAAASATAAVPAPAAAAPGADEKAPAIAHFHAGRYPELEAEARALTARYPDAGWCWKVLGLALHFQGKDAIAALEKAAAMLPEDAGAHGTLGAACLGAGRPDAAAASCRRALALDPAYADAHCNLGIALHALGHHDAAVESLERALSLEPAMAPALSALGAALQALGRPDAAVARHRQAVALQPGFATAHCNLAAALIALRRFDEAAASCRRAIDIDPANAAAHTNLAVALHETGDAAAALASADRALAIDPADAQAHNTRGNALQALGRVGEALEGYRRALAARPGFAEAHSNLGNALRDLGRLREAIDSYRQAIALDPGFADAHNNLGASLQAVGRLTEAAAACRRALEIRPAHAEAHSNLGNILRDQGRLEDAAASLTAALAIRPGFAAAASNLGSVYRSMGRIAEARAQYARAQALGYAGAHVLDAMLLPAIMGTRDAVLASRAEFERRVEDLTVRGIAQADPLRDIGEANFYLAYHARNDRDLQRKVARYYEAACPTLLFTAPHCRRPARDADRPVRVGFFSRYLYEHSVSLCFSEIIESLSAGGEFEAVLVSNSPVDATSYARFAGRRVQVPYHLEGAREAIAALELDILVYLDIGMEPLGYFLAFARLARIQMVLTGHPVTTGIGNLDYFVSSCMMEPEGADAHYSEKLVQLPTPLFYFAKPAMPARLKTRAELGLPAGRHLYMCPMRLQKMHPDFDAALARILALDRDGLVVLFEDIEITFGKRLLLARFEETLPEDARRRIVFLPWMSDPADFKSAVAAADVILDPFHFGIGSTAMITFAMGTPLVTWPGEFMRGRVGKALCDLLDLPECIADGGTDDYAARAVALASDAALRARVADRIGRNSHVLFDNPRPAAEFAGLLRRMARDIHPETAPS